MIAAVKRWTVAGASAVGALIAMNACDDVCAFLLLSEHPIDSFHLEQPGRADASLSRWIVRRLCAVHATF